MGSRILVPGQAEIIRASQKDLDFIKKLQEDLNEVIQQTFGQNVWQKFRERFSHLPTLLYYSLTNLAGYQTLGEEYAGILQIDETGRNIPTNKAILTMILFIAYGQPMLEYVIRLLDSYLVKIKAQTKSRDVTENSNLKQDQEDWNWVITAQEVLRVFKQYLPFFGQLHLALFYLQGQFYHFSKRLLGIKYVLVRQWYANHDDGSKQNLKYLMWLSIINSMLTGINDSITYVKSRNASLNGGSPDTVVTPIISCDTNDEENDHATNVDSTKKCTLCLEERKHSSVTTCGHLFCWNCIVDWLRTKQECPVCREKVPPSRVVPLQNYS